MKDTGSVVPVPPDQAQPAEPHRSRRASVVIAFVSGAAVAAIAVATWGGVTWGGGTGSADTPPTAPQISDVTTSSPSRPPDTSIPAPASPTTTDGSVTSAATLNEQVPNLGAEVLTIGYMNDEGLFDRTHWAAISPRPVAEPDQTGSRLPPLGTDLTDRPRFDARGQSLAWHDGLGGLVVDYTTVAAGVSGWGWHPTGDGIAWVAQPPGTTDWVVYLMGDLVMWRTGIVEVVTLPGADGLTGWRLAAWGDWGYAVTGTRFESPDFAEITVILDPDGQPQTAHPARVLAAAADGSIVLSTTTRPDDATNEWDTIADELALGAPLHAAPRGISIRRPDGASHGLPFQTNATPTALITPHGDTVLALVQSVPTPGQVGGSWDVTVVDPNHTRDQSTTHVAGDLTPLGLSRNGQWVLFAGRRPPTIADARGLPYGDGLTLHDWREGRTHHVDFDLGLIVSIHM